MKGAVLEADDIRTFLEEQYPSKKGSITEATDLLNDEVLDSLGIVTLIAFLEERYGISLDYDELTEDNFRRIAAIVDLVNKKRAGDGR